MSFDIRRFRGRAPFLFMPYHCSVFFPRFFRAFRTAAKTQISAAPPAMAQAAGMPIFSSTKTRAFSPKAGVLFLVSTLMQAEDG